MEGDAERAGGIKRRDAGEYQDELFSRFYSGQYVVRDMDELLALTSLKVDIQRLLLLDERYVRRH